MQLLKHRFIRGLAAMFRLPRGSVWRGMRGIVLLSLVIGAASAQAQGQCVYTSTVVFGNGILTTQQGAIDGRDSLKARIKDYFTAEEFQNIGFDVAQNTSAGAINDLVETAVQIEQTDPQFSWVAYWLGLSGFGNGNIVMAEIVSLYYNLSGDALQAQQDMSDQLGLYRSITDNGGHIVLVAHSQGNLFASLAYSQLTAAQQNNISVVGVAVPSTSVPGNGFYVTLQSDLVISGLALAKALALLPLPLDANEVNNSQSEDWTGHYFLPSYLDGDRSGIDIINTVVNNIVDGPAICRG
jgi:hypothetical protein